MIIIIILSLSFPFHYHHHHHLQMGTFLSRIPNTKSWGKIIILWLVWLSILLYGYTTLTLILHTEKRHDGNCTRMFWAIQNKSWKQHLTKQQLYGHQPSISITIKIRWTRHAEHCWRSKSVIISNVLQWTSFHRPAGVGCPARTYLQQLCTDVAYGQNIQMQRNPETLTTFFSSGMKLLLPSWLLGFRLEEGERHSFY